jgi:hypothetical protein
MGELVRKLGTESLKDFKERFDEICDEYQAKAKKQGYNGKLLFKKEHGKMIIFVSLEEKD